MEEDSLSGTHFCGSDIKAGQKFVSKSNVMTLIVHTYSLLRTISNGFSAKIHFLDQLINESITDFNSTDTTLKFVNSTSLNSTFEQNDLI